MENSFEDRTNYYDSSDDNIQSNSSRSARGFEFSLETIHKLRTTAQPQEEVSKFPDSSKSYIEIELEEAEDFKYSE